MPSSPLITNRRGVALLLALLVLAAILLGSLTASNLVLGELKLTRTSDQGLAAFYAAESGLEQGLYLFRQEGKEENTVGELLVDESDALILSGNDAEWWRSSTLTEPNFTATLEQNQVAEIVLFDPDNVSSQAGSVNITWQSNTSLCPSAGTEWLEVVQSWWNTSIASSQSSRTLFSASSSSGAVVNRAGDYPSVRLRALFTDICNLTLTAYNGANKTNGTFPLPARLTVTATGQLDDTKQALSVTVPQYAPQFGSFDYTIFSECSLTKGLVEACP